VRALAQHRSQRREGRLMARANNGHKHYACFEAFGLTFGGLCSLVAIVARHRHGLETTRVDVEEFLRKEEQTGTETGYFRELERLRLIRETRRAGNKRWYAPTSTGLAKVSHFGRQGQAA
jgi:hypothetical protein